MRTLLYTLSLSSLLLILNNILNAQTWLPAMGQGVDDAPASWVEDIVEFEGDIVITGEFSSVSGVACSYVARWNGTSWEAMGSGLPAVGRCLAVYNGELYAGMDDLGAGTLQKWNGSSWVSSGNISGPIATLYVDPLSNDFYAGGYFTSPGNYIAKFNGTTWQGVGNLSAGTASFPGVRAISVYNGTLYVGGTFGGGTASQFVAKFNGTSFVALNSATPNQPVNCFLQKDGLLYLGGAFSRVGPTGSPFTPSVIAYDGTNWQAVSNDESGPANGIGGVKDMITYKEQIYAIGVFPIIFNSTVEANNLARWNDCSWKNVTDGVSPNGLNGNGYSLAVFGDDLYVGGEFTIVGGNANNKRIAKWNAPIECPDPICFPANAEISISANTTFGCVGTPFVFTASTETGGSNPIYTWKVDGNTVGTNSPTFSSNSLTDGQNVTCELISNDACMSNTNATSNSIQVSIVTEVTPTISIVADNTTFCIGSTVNFDASTTFGGSIPNYQWQVNGANVGSNTPNFSSSSFANGDVVTCLLTSSESCANPTIVSSNDVVLNVTSSIAPTIIIAASQTIICEGSSVDFTASISGGGNAPSYQWKKNGSNVGINSSTFSSSTLSDGDILICILTSDDVCASPSSVSSNSISMVVNTSPTPTISISASQTTICLGDNVTFTSNITNGGSNPSYQWQVNGSNTGTNSATFNSSSITSGQTITCVLSSDLSCTSDVTSNGISITVNSPTNPSVTITSDVNQICEGTNVTFTAAGSNAGANPIYKWFHNNVLVGTNSANYSANNFANGDFVYCVLEANGSCGGNVSNDISNYIVMNVLTEAVVETSSNQLISLTSGDAYQWVNCSTGEIISNAVGAIFTPLEAGSYKVLVQLSSCQVESDCYNIFVEAGLKENKTNLIQIYPNPSNGKFNIASNFSLSQIQVFNLNGEILETIQSNGASTLNFDISTEADGIYFIKVLSQNESSLFYRIVKN